MERRHLLRLVLTSVSAIVLACLPCSAQQRQPVSGPELRVRDNVYVIPDKNARFITGWLIVLAGCADEADGQCVGIAHYLEHLLFINRDNDHRSKVAYFADGTGNGWTTHRATAYFQRFPSRADTNAQNLDKLMGYFAGLLTDVRVEDAQADRERNVVMQEYQQNTGRNPFARFGIALNLALMPDEPLGQRVIGSPETIRAFTPAAARAFHEKWYASNNAAIVLHGPISSENVAALVERHLAPLPAKQIPPRSWQRQQRYQAGSQLLRTTDKEVRRPGVYLEKIVTYSESAQMKREISAANIVLGSFLSSRLSESPLEILMERDGLVTDARISVGRIRDGALRVSFSGAPSSGVAPEKVIDAARAYILDLARKGLDQATVDRLKMRIRNERALLAEQPPLYAQALTNWLAGHGTYDDWRSRQDQGEAVTVASVNALLSLIAGPGREVVGILLPGTPPTASANERVNERVPPAAETPPQQSSQ